MGGRGSSSNTRNPTVAQRVAEGAPRPTRAFYNAALAEGASERRDARSMANAEIRRMEAELRDIEQRRTVPGVTSGRNINEFISGSVAGMRDRQRADALRASIATLRDMFGIEEG